MVVLVGGSSTGKTRAAFEAVRQCLPDWSLLRPVDAADLLEQVRSGAAGPQTVLWLNETQIFLRGQPDVAVALRRLLAGDEPVVVVGTMWPEFWKELTSAPDDGGPDVNHQARELLLHDADRVDVPETFAGRDLVQLNHVLAADPRLATAAEAAGSDGKVVQVLAGGPELVQRYDHPADAEDRFGKAVLTAAMDARRARVRIPDRRVFPGGRGPGVPGSLRPGGCTRHVVRDGPCSRHPRDPRHRGTDRATAGTRHRARRWIRAARLPRSARTADASRGAHTGSGVGCAHRRCA